MVNPRDTVSPSRLEAAKALYSMEKGAKISDVLELKRNLIPEDEALLRELVYGCTRQKRLLDYHLNSFCTTAYDQLPIEVKVALRLGIYQLYFLDRIPAHAAVHESVNLAKQGGQEKLSGFVNAVLRNAETKKAERVIKGESDIDTMALQFSHPTWMVKRWAKNMTPEQLEQTLKADNSPHPVYLRVAPGSRARVIETLGRQNVRVTETTWPIDTLSLKSHEGGLFSGESFQKGEWIVQDWVPQAMLDLLPLNEGQRVWDVCAAPGGKTIGLAWKTGEKGQVMASDASAERRKRLIENVNRIGLKQVSVFDHEITKLSPAQKFDMAWVDAPFSGTGVLSRRADLRWRLMPKDVIEHADQQKDLLVQAQGHLYPKGYLVYSTCSLEREENQRVIEAFVKDYPEFKPVNLKVPEGYPEISRDELGLTFLPTAEHDGGFMSVLSR
jgi:16S rRNA (cytosine967-C5)-methyltransferase